MGSFAPEHGYQELVDLYQARYAYLRQKYEATSDLEMVHTADQQITPVDRPILGLIALQKQTGGLLPATILYCDSGLGSPILDLLHLYANAFEDDYKLEIINEKEIALIKQGGLKENFWADLDWQKKFNELMLHGLGILYRQYFWG